MTAKARLITINVNLESPYKSSYESPYKFKILILQQDLNQKYSCK